MNDLTEIERFKQLIETVTIGCHFHQIEGCTGEATWLLRELFCCREKEIQLFACYSCQERILAGMNHHLQQGTMKECPYCNKIMPADQYFANVVWELL